MPVRRKYETPLSEATIGTRIRGLRHRRGLTQVELAGKLGMHQSLLSRYERGELRLHGALVASFAKALGVKTDDILGPKEPTDAGAAGDRRFMRRLQMIGKLSKRQKEALLQTLDTFLKGAGVA
jgi:transcriptional regulator with XRE-family HTH domain